MKSPFQGTLAAHQAKREIHTGYRTFWCDQEMPQFLENKENLNSYQETAAVKAPQRPTNAMQGL